MRTEKKTGRGENLSLYIRTIWVFIALVLLTSLGGLLPAALADYTEGYLQYVLNDGRVEITGYFGEETETVVPARIAGYPVSVIRTGAFSAAETLTKVTLPDTVTEIREGAFSEGQAVVYTTQDALQTVSFPATYENTGETATGVVVTGAEAEYASTEQTSTSVTGVTTTINTEKENSSVTTDSYGLTDFGTIQVNEMDPYSEEIEFDEAQSEVFGTAAPVSTPEAVIPEKQAESGAETIEQETAEKRAAEEKQNNLPASRSLFLAAVFAAIAAAAAVVLLILTAAERRRSSRAYRNRPGARSR